MNAVVWQQQIVVNPGVEIDAIFCVHPLNNALSLYSRIVFAGVRAFDYFGVNAGHSAVLLVVAGAFDNIRAFKTSVCAHSHTLILGRRNHFEVAFVDV